MTPHLGQGQHSSGWSLHSRLCVSSPDLERTLRSGREAVGTAPALVAVGIESAYTAHSIIAARIAFAARTIVFGITARVAETGSAVDGSSSVAELTVRSGIAVERLAVAGGCAAAGN